MQRLLPHVTRFCPGLLAAFLALPFFTGNAYAQQPGTSPVKIYVMIGQSNTEGHGEISPVTTQGTLQYMVANDPSSNYQFLVNPGATDIATGTTNWVVRDDVWVHYERLGTFVPRVGGLTPGYGANGGNVTIGPELGFGHSMGNTLTNQVLLVKTCWGGKSLGTDFLPPSSGPYPDPRVPGDKGFYYKEVLRLVNDATTKLGNYFPNYNGQGYEIAGICWHQGWNDRVTPADSATYQTNLANFIRDIRSNTNGLGVPGLPFVIATTGMDGELTYSDVEKAQRAMVNPYLTHPAPAEPPDLYSDFVGNVAVVDTRVTYAPLGLDFWQPVANSPQNQGYHWNRNAKTYLHIGLAMGHEMPLLTSPLSPSRLRATGGPSGVTLTWQNGSETPTSVQVLRDGVPIAAAAPVSPANYVDNTTLPGAHDYQLVFTMPVTPSDPLTVTHDSGISSLSAYRSTGGVTLNWTNNLGYPSIQIQRNGSTIQAAYSGSATSYEDTTSPATGLLTYTLVPTSGSSTPAQVQINLGPHTSPGALIYEPFDMAAGASLNNLVPSGFGLSGNWNRQSGTTSNEFQVASGGLSYGTLPAVGNRVRNNNTGGGRTNNAAISNVLANEGLLADGATLWFSTIVRPVSSVNTICGLGLVSGTSSATITSYDNANNVNGVGINLNGGNDVEYCAWKSGTPGTYLRASAKPDLALNTTFLIVGKLVWGTGGGNDTFEIFMPDNNLNQGTRLGAVQSIDIDQSTLNRIAIYNSGGSIEFDDIRFGATYGNVIGQGVDTTGDFTAPTPATMSFATAPTAISPSSITMIATTASDANGVQYRFLETSGNPGSTNSTWQDSPVYTDSGLDPNTEYTYTVQAKDKSVNNNTNTVSSSASATTLAPDTTPPPIPGFASGPTATSSSAITMIATVVADPEGGSVQYLFTETSGNTGGTSSGWQSSPSYTDTGLSASTQYSYTVKARDSASPPNESNASTAQSTTTLAAGGPGGALIYEPFDMPVGTLDGHPGGYGLSGNWTRYAGSSTSDFTVQSPGATYSNLSTDGKTIGVIGNSNRRYRASIGTTLSSAGLLADGAELWFSVLITPRTDANSRAQFMLANGDISTDQGGIGTTGDGIGINLQNGSDLRTVTCDGGVTANVTIQDNLTLNATRLIVAKIVWGTGGASDTMYIYRPGTNLALPVSPEKTVTADLAQTTFDRLSIASLNNATDWDEIRFGASYEAVIGQGTSGPGPLDHFAISAIGSPKTVGTPITGISLTAQDAANQTVTGFTGTVNFGGTGGFSGISGTFTAGVLSGVNVTPTTAGSNLTLTVTDGVSGKTGSTTITAIIQNPYTEWSGGADFDADSNGDGVKNGLAFFLGAVDKEENATAKLPVVSQVNGALKLTFKCLNETKRGSAVLKVQYSKDLGLTDLWSSHDSAVVPGTAPVTSTVGGVDFVTTIFDANMNNVEATIPASVAEPGNTIFGRLMATP